MKGSHIILQSGEALSAPPSPELLTYRSIQITVCTSPVPRCDLTHRLVEKPWIFSSSPAYPSL